MAKNCVAIDIGASSGRVIIGSFQEGKLSLKEVYRFKNTMVKDGQSYYWDVEGLFGEIVKGLKKADKEGQEIQSIGIDTWAVDYVLLDKTGKPVSPVYAYRDHRTDETIDKVLGLISLDKIYNKTGIQFLQFNTIYQLFEHCRKDKEVFERADSLLMIPDYLNFLLTGEKAIEFTNATTTQLFNIHDMQWDQELIKITGVDKSIFPTVLKAGSTLGVLSKEIQSKTGLSSVKVILPATHDTGSAVVSVPAVTEDFAYISSGTWSLMGIESKTPICTETVRRYNFTNEGGAFETFRVLKNIMGLWIIQEVQRLYDNLYSFGELVKLAEKAEPFKCLINPNDKRFLNPENMIQEIQKFCKETGQSIPVTAGEIARCVFESLAFQYKEVLIQLREISCKSINRIHIVGGGAQNKLLNELCADFTGCEVWAGPIEATAIGNLLVQFIALEEIESLNKAREMIINSFSIEKYFPKETNEIEVNWNRFLKLK